jgi:hypothetical protein
MAKTISTLCDIPGNKLPGLLHKVMVEKNKNMHLQSLMCQRIFLNCSLKIKIHSVTTKTNQINLNEQQGQ